MGATFAKDLASMQNLSMQQQVEIHLVGNFYPPVPTSMVEPCMRAIDAYWEDDLSRLIILPDGVFWHGQTTAPAEAIINQHKLYAWVQENSDE